VADRVAMEVENGHYVSDLEENCITQENPTQGHFLGYGRKLSQTILVLFWELPLFYYRTRMKVWRKYRLLAAMLIENEIIFRTIFPM